MIKINLLAERKAAKSKTPSVGRPSAEPGAPGAGQNLLLIAILILGAAIAGGWWWTLKSDLGDWTAKHEAADRELERLAEVRAKGEEFKAQKELLARKIDLITELKKRQAAPVHILDQVSKNLPEFLWLDSMSASASEISISGKATNYNAVSSFYQNLTDSGYFKNVALGRTFEVSEGVAFSLTCQFAAPATTGQRS